MFNGYNPYGGSIYQTPFPVRPIIGQPNSYQNMAAGMAFQPNQQYFPYQAQPQMAQQPIQQQMPQQPVMHVRAVTGLEEARAAQIDFDGSIYVFPDLGNGKIYVKQFSFQTGAANFQTYKVEEPFKDNAAAVRSLGKIFLSSPKQRAAEPAAGTAICGEQKTVACNGFGTRGISAACAYVLLNPQVPVRFN